MSLANSMKAIHEESNGNLIASIFRVRISRVVKNDGNILMGFKGALRVHPIILGPSLGHHSEYTSVFLAVQYL